MDHSKMHNMSPPSSSSTANDTNSNMEVMHMTFFWGKNTDVLFAGWPGTSSGMYAICLIVVFLLAVIAEWLAHSSILQGCGATSRAAGLAQTTVYTLKTGLAYLVMLVAMSFNVGVFIAAIAGFSVGFMLFGSTTFKKPSDSDYRKTTELLYPSSGCVC